jgi:hypothetical protein
VGREIMVKTRQIDIFKYNRTSFPSGLSSNKSYELSGLKNPHPDCVVTGMENADDSIKLDQREDTW